MFETHCFKILQIIKLFKMDRRNVTWLG